jgi:type II secretion system protein G
MREQLRKKREEGFTLIELLIVIIILAILAAIVVFAVGSTAGNAKISACNADAKSVETAVEAYKAQLGSFPANMSSLTVTTTAVITEGGGGVYNATYGPWLRAVPSANTGADGYSIAYAGGTVSVVDTAGVFNYDAGGACAKA